MESEDEEEVADHHESGPWVDVGDRALVYSEKAGEGDESRVWAYRFTEPEADAEAKGEEEEDGFLGADGAGAGAEVEEYRIGRAVKIRRDEDA